VLNPIEDAHTKGLSTFEGDEGIYTGAPDPVAGNDREVIPPPDMPGEKSHRTAPIRARRSSLAKLGRWRTKKRATWGGLSEEVERVATPSSTPPVAKRVLLKPQRLVCPLTRLFRQNSFFHALFDEVIAAE